MTLPWYMLPLKPVQQEGKEKLPDGCCHKTVVTRCKDCSFSKAPNDLSQRDYPDRSGGGFRGMSMPGD
jgi:hypothetical protein